MIAKKNGLKPLRDLESFARHKKVSRKDREDRKEKWLKTFAELGVLCKT
jgi:hypothetical protein